MTEIGGASLVLRTQASRLLVLLTCEIGIGFRLFRVYRSRWIGDVQIERSGERTHCWYVESNFKSVSGAHKDNYFPLGVIGFDDVGKPCSVDGCKFLGSQIVGFELRLRKILRFEINTQSTATAFNVSEITNTRKEIPLIIDDLHSVSVIGLGFLIASIPAAQTASPRSVVG